MAERRHALILTGPPGVGKTTVIRRVIEGLAGWRLRGFTTEEIREGGQRVGFRLTTLDGRRLVLAHVGIRAPQRVGRYGVDLQALESVLDAAVARDPSTDVHILDEIGKMECLSARFVGAMTALLDSGRLVVATVAARGPGLIEAVKGRSDVEVWTVTPRNRIELPSRVLAWLAERAAAPGT